MICKVAQDLLFLRHLYMQLMEIILGIDAVNHRKNEFGHTTGSALMLTFGADF